MSNPIHIAIDAMGGDHGPSVVVPGLAAAGKALTGRGVRFLVFGDEPTLQAEFARCPAALAVSEIRHTERDEKDNNDNRHDQDTENDHTLPLGTTLNPFNHSNQPAKSMLVSISRCNKGEVNLVW